jgi:hypothetical protein
VLALPHRSVRNLKNKQWSQSTPGLHRLASLAADAAQEADDLGRGSRGERQVCQALQAAQERALRARRRRAAVGEPQRTTSRQASRGVGTLGACAGRASRGPSKCTLALPHLPHACTPCARASGIAGLQTPMQPEAAIGGASLAPVHDGRTGSPPPVTSLQSSEAATTGAAPRATAGDAASHAPAPSPASSALNSTSQLPPRAAVCTRLPAGAQGPAWPAGPRLH